MDQIKIGRFIAACRKENNLTQLQLAEKLNITDRAVSKWENGKTMPDSAIMLELCDVLGISVNDLLNGEKLSMETYNRKTEEKLLDIIQEKERSDRLLMRTRVWLLIMDAIFSTTILLLIWKVVLPFEVLIALWLFGVVASFMLGGLSDKIFQAAGYCQCKHCGHTYTPARKQLTFAMLWFDKVYIRCPECNRKSWHEKVYRKD